MNIAVCDDDRAICEQVIQLIKIQNPEAKTASFHSAEDLLKTQINYDIYFLDIAMDAISGIELAKAVRKRQEETSTRKSIIIFITGYREYMEEAFDVNAFHYLVKPINEENFRQFFIVQVMVIEVYDSKYGINDIAKILIYIAILFFIQTMLYRKDIAKQIFVLFSFLAGKEIVKYIVSVVETALCELIGTITNILINNGIIYTIEKTKLIMAITSIIYEVVSIMLYAVLLWAYLRLISRKFVRKDYQLRTQENIFLILPCIAALCISIAMKMMILSVENGITTIIYDTVPETMFWIPLICVLLLSTIIACVVLFQKLVQYNEETNRRMVLENQVIQMQREIAEVQDIYSDMRGLRHDMRNHLTDISLYVKNTVGSESEALNSYIGKMEKTVSKLDFAYQTGNPITDIIIHQKSQEAQKNQINFEVDFIYPKEQDIDAYDIGIILNNALENAIEACCKLANGKHIYLCSYMKGNLFFMEIENEFSDELKLDDETGLPISSKEDKSQHGFGISNIQRCARKYQGDIDIAISNSGNVKLFNLTVMMCGKISHQ